MHINEEEVPQLVEAIANNLGKQLALTNLAAYTIPARSLKLPINLDKIEIAACLRVDGSIL